MGWAASILTLQLSRSTVDIYLKPILGITLP